MRWTAVSYTHLDVYKRQPYGEWLDGNLISLGDLPIPNRKVETAPPEELVRLQKAFGYAYEDVKNTILPMALTGAEPTAAMGADIPLAVLDLSLIHICCACRCR